ncbi:MAG: 3-oxoacyl-ACP reductase [Solirubrobacterales bacterium]|jgi:2-hydroxycyclohexanecarboxyl-CoA dehydrogenase|nr:3-oxoacyl-ACP reductase [Solirubrobacterales bacterium]
MRRYEGRRVLVTGGGKGIGAGIVRRLAAEGAHVIVAGRTRSSVEEVADEVGGEAVQVDISDVEAAQAAIVAAGTLDVLVNNAGFDDPGFFSDTTPERWRRLLDTNLMGTFACTQAALPGMRAAGYGRILNVGSEAGRIGSKGNAVYAATKGALSAFTKSIAREEARYGITVNCLVVGPVDTPLLDQVRATEHGPRMVAAMKAGTLVRRLGRVEEIAAAAAFACAEEASFVTAEDLAVSGGMGIA